MTRPELLALHDRYEAMRDTEAYQDWIRQLSFADTTELQEAIAERKRGNDAR